MAALPTATLVRQTIEARARGRNGKAHPLSIAELEKREPPATEWLARAVWKIAFLPITQAFFKLDFGESLRKFFLGKKMID